MRKINGLLLCLNIVLAFTILTASLNAQDNTGGYAERIAILEAKIINHETRIASLEHQPTATTTTTNTGGQWQDLDGNTIFMPKPDTMGFCSATSHKFHFWEGCQFYAPVRTYEVYSKMFPDITPCILCMKHLVPPGNGLQAAPAGAIKQPKN